MPKSSFIGKKREMYEHPVFCLASQVMDLTIREYLPPSSPCCLHSFLFSLLQYNPDPNQLTLLASSLLALACLLLLSVKVPVWEVQSLFYQPEKQVRKLKLFLFVMNSNLSLSFLFSSSFCLWPECIFTLLLCNPNL